jgi:general transcription factor 3C polypeptide 3 (transcription factor C subunit 4)
MLDADSEYREFRAEMNKLQSDVNQLRGSANPGDDTDMDGSHNRVRQRIGRPRSGPGRGRGARAKGPRRAAEPTGDIKLRLALAHQAFELQNYLEAKSIAFEIIRINAETYEAWTLLAGTFQELGDMDNAVMAYVIAAHFRPKIISSWLAAAKFALEETGEHRSKYFASVQFCYAAAIRNDPKNVDAHLGKAYIYLERGNSRLAVSEFKFVLEARPHDIQIIRSLAEAYVDQGEIQNAIDLYKETISHFKSTPEESDLFSWTDADVYSELYASLGQHDLAIRELKCIARWLLGREDENFWDEVTYDDCEWDTDHSRRSKIPAFGLDNYALSSYGGGLPLDLRVKLGLYRLRLGHYDEAMVG